MIEWVNFINKAYINLTAPTIKVFKLDKVQTDIDTLYGEAKNRIYLPPFEVRAFHLTNYWQQMLGPMGTQEVEETMQFVVNFEDMVQRIRALSFNRISNMYITYSGTGTPSSQKVGNIFNLRINNSDIANYTLTDSDYNTVKKLANVINSLDNFSVSLSGRNDSSTNLVSFSRTKFLNQTLHVYSLDNTYQNATDVIESGDAILTNKWRLYEVRNARPTGDFGWDWVTYSLDCQLARIDQMDLPADYAQEIEEHQYGIGHKISME